MKNILGNLVENFSQSFDNFLQTGYSENITPVFVFFTMIFIVVRGYNFFYKEDDVNPKRKSLFVAKVVFSFASGFLGFIAFVFAIVDPFTAIKDFPAPLSIVVMLIAFVAKESIWQKYPIIVQIFLCTMLFIFNYTGYEILPFPVYIASLICGLLILNLIIKKLVIYIKNLFSLPEQYWFKP